MTDTQTAAAFVGQVAAETSMMNGVRFQIIDFLIIKDKVTKFSGSLLFRYPGVEMHIESYFKVGVDLIVLIEIVTHYKSSFSNWI